MRNKTLFHILISNVQETRTSDIVFYISRIRIAICSVLVIVKNTELKATVMKEADTSKDKKDVTNVRYSLNGKVCGVHAVDSY